LRNLEQQNGIWKIFYNYEPKKSVEMKHDLLDIYTEVKIRTGWKSEGRIMGEVAEMYFQRYVNCQRCGELDYMKCPTNEKSRISPARNPVFCEGKKPIDFVCKKCGINYQIKCKKVSPRYISNIEKTHSIQMAGAEYFTTLKNIDKKIDYMILLYDRFFASSAATGAGSGALSRRAGHLAKNRISRRRNPANHMLKDLVYVKYETVDQRCVKARNPLKKTARRAGWKGCNLLFSNVLLGFLPSQKTGFRAGEILLTL
jgi:Dam-replacing family